MLVHMTDLTTVTRGQARDDRRAGFRRGGRPDGQAPRRPTAPRALLAIVLTGQFMAVLDASVVNVAAPAIHADLHASGAGLQLVIAGYVITYAVLLVTGARPSGRPAARRNPERRPAGTWSRVTVVRSVMPPSMPGSLSRYQKPTYPGTRSTWHRLALPGMMRL